ncbi:uncharacterized protein EV422DRAFT_568979 [Fimicolochytrium jonesii]|uniref:uncharacterized protein n=1 Tax=Fimicolochytrium jonesii TaxID=1396493 RepID=UPI0022FEC92F|nr:uncharacterized protein EV422DRAFT_568979 [Fimicolochytrium jonesii]KAI8819119.1 hypothetical protein EV422DRAFT_568979 [Fimicolochytrium jonesii]
MPAAPAHEHLVNKHLAKDSQKVDALVSKGVQRDQIVTPDQLPAHHRVIPASGMMTMDFRPERLNLEVDEQDVIKRQVGVTV